MRSVLLTKSFLVIIAALGAACFAARADCDPREFMIKEVKDIQKSGETELAFVLTATEEEFNRAKKDAAGSGTYGLISGSASYAESKEKARRIAQSTKFDYKSSYAESYFSQSLSPAAINAYVACLQSDRERPGLTMWLQGRQGEYLTFKAFWVGADVTQPSAKYDAAPIIDGGTIVAKPDGWIKAKAEEIVVKRNGNNDVFLSLRVGGQSRSQVIVKDPPAVIWNNKPVTSDKLIRAVATGPNPGCTAGQVTDCIFPARPGGSFVERSGAMTERSTSDPGRYSEEFYVDTPDKICVRMTQSQGACEKDETAQGRLTAIERFPQSAE